MSAESPRRAFDFPDKDLPLRDDVRTLGALVGDMLREQGGEELFQAVEKARRAAIRRREAVDFAGGDDGERELCELFATLSPKAAEEVVRGFAAYFRVVNLAEQIHRIRRRREYLRQAGDGHDPQPFSLEDTLRKLHAAGVERSEIDTLFERMSIEPVFTAHPTEATRRSLLEKQQDIARRLVERFDPDLTPQEKRQTLERIRADVTTAWQTEESPPERPTVSNEAEHVLFYLTDILYRILPVFYEDLDEALETVYGEPSEGEIPRMISFASWVGGDMDGNPNVDAETLAASLELHRRLALGSYRKEVSKLARQLSQSTSRVGVDAAVHERIDELSELLPHVAEKIPARHRDMPYRTLLRLMEALLEDDCHYDADAYLRDLDRIAASLERHQGKSAGLFNVRRARRRAAHFGFHLATLDVRQDAEVHRRVVGELLADGEWSARSAAERAERLRRSLAEGDGHGAGSDEAERVLKVFGAIAEGRRRHGGQAVGPYIISMARDVDDVLSVLQLARWGGLTGSDGNGGRDENGGGDGSIHLDVVPLFETVDDLEAAPEVMARLFADDFYRAHLEHRERRQMVMIGYSDSSKDGGIASSRWALHRGQAALAEVFAAAGIELVLFHGRGGTVSRGGGKLHRAVMAAPAGSVNARLRLTEQGEVIDDKYGLRGIALRSLERAWGAVALATATPPAGAAGKPCWREAMDEVARTSRRAYRARVYDDPEFFTFFRQATPIDVIERLKIGSRPASRRSGKGIENLRAIPWVFSWTQSRLTLPGWYGLGAGLAAAVESFGEDEIAEMVRQWPFAANLIDDAEMVLAKADLPIAERYAQLAGDLGRRLFAEIRQEFERTVELVLRLKGTAVLLEHDPTLRRSIRLRNPYVDPMSLLQVDLLERWRKNDRQDEELLQALLATVHGIAQGLQNTG